MFRFCCFLLRPRGLGLAALLLATVLRPHTARAQNAVFDIEGIYLDAGWSLGHTTLNSTPYLGSPTTDSYQTGQILLRYKFFTPKHFLLMDISGWANYLLDYSKPYVRAGALKSGTGFGNETVFTSLCYAVGSPYLKLGGQAWYGNFGLIDPAYPAGALAQGRELMAGLSLHGTIPIGQLIGLRLSGYEDRIFSHAAREHGWATTGEVEAIIGGGRKVSLLLGYRYRRRFFAGRHSGEASQFSTDPKLINPLARDLDFLPARISSHNIDIGLAFRMGKQ